jgi:hypothetical protein
MTEVPEERIDNANYTDWTAVFQRVLENPSAIGGACPNCDHHQLQLVFENVDRESGIGQVAFWCNYCLTGIMFGRSNAIPEFPVSYRNHDAPPVAVPNFRLIPPP